MQVYVLSLKWPGQPCEAVVAIGATLEWTKNRAHHHLEEVDDGNDPTWFFHRPEKSQRDLTISGTFHQGEDGWCGWSTDPHTWKAPLVDREGKPGEDPGGYIIREFGVEGMDPPRRTRQEPRSDEQGGVIRLLPDRDED